MSNDNSLNSLLTASSIVSALDTIKGDLKSLREDVDVIKGAKTPRNSVSLPTSETVVTPSTSWAAAMDEIDPIEDGRSPGEEEARNIVRLTDVLPRTEECIKAAFKPMRNVDRRQLRSQHTVPKLEATKTPDLDKFMADGCSKSTKAADKAIGRIQALTLDAVGPLAEALDLINTTTDAEQPDLDLEKVATCIEAAVTFLGNAACNMSTLRCTKILEEYNKDLLSFAEDRDEEFLKAAPMLFGSSFPKDAQEHLQQVETLRKAKGKQAFPSFQRAPLQSSQGGRRHNFSLTRRSLYTQGGGGGNPRMAKGVQSSKK